MSCLPLESVVACVMDHPTPNSSGQGTSEFVSESTTTPHSVFSSTQQQQRPVKGGTGSSCGINNVYGGGIDGDDGSGIDCGSSKGSSGNNNGGKGGLRVSRYAEGRVDLNGRAIQSYSDGELPPGGNGNGNGRNGGRLSKKIKYGRKTAGRTPSSSTINSEGARATTPSFGKASVDGSKKEVREKGGENTEGNTFGTDIGSSTKKDPEEKSSNEAPGNTASTSINEIRSSNISTSMNSIHNYVRGPQLSAPGCSFGLASCNALIPGEWGDGDRNGGKLEGERGWKIPSDEKGGANDPPMMRRIIAGVDRPIAVTFAANSTADNSTADNSTADNSTAAATAPNTVNKNSFKYVFGLSSTIASSPSSKHSSSLVTTPMVTPMVTTLVQTTDPRPPSPFDPSLTGHADVISRCFFSGYLPTTDVISSLSLVSKAYREVARTTVKKLDLKSLYVGVGSCRAAFDTSPRLEKTILGSVLTRFVNVSELFLDYCAGIEDSCCVVIASALSHSLSTLSLRGTDVTDAGVKSIVSCKNLTSLDLSKSTVRQSSMVTNEGVKAIARGGLRKLRFLGTGWCRGVGGDGVEGEVRDGCKGLTTWDLELCTGIDNESLKTIGQMYLKHLNLSGNKVITDRGLLFLTKPDILLPKEDVATTPGIIINDGSNSPTGSSRSGSSRCGNSSSGSGNGNDSFHTFGTGSSRLAQKCALQTVELRHCTNITPTGLEMFLYDAPDLRRIDVSHCERLGWRIRGNGEGQMGDGRPEEIARGLRRRGVEVERENDHVVRLPV